MNIFSVKRVLSCVAGYALVSTLGCSVSEPDAFNVLVDPLKNGGHGPRMVNIPAGVAEIPTQAGEYGPFAYYYATDIVKGADVSHTQFQLNAPIHLSQFEITWGDLRIWRPGAGLGPDDTPWPDEIPAGQSYSDARRYAYWLSTQTGHLYRIPTRHEWAYAAKGGQQTRFYWGAKFDQGKGNVKKTRIMNVFKGKLFSIEAVGNYPPNQYGLYDMLGNEAEVTDSCSFLYDDTESISQNSNSLDIFSCKRVVAAGHGAGSGSSNFYGEGIRLLRETQAFTNPRNHPYHDFFTQCGTRVDTTKYGFYSNTTVSGNVVPDDLMEFSIETSTVLDHEGLAAAHRVMADYCTAYHDAGSVNRFYAFMMSMYAPSFKVFSLNKKDRETLSNLFPEEKKPAVLAAFRRADRLPAGERTRFLVNLKNALNESDWRSVEKLMTGPTSQ